ncbi:MAG: hypothetical protein WEA75_04730 [Acidimicrobiia bacterium]
MPQPRDHLINLAASILDSADDLDSVSAGRRAYLADALEVLLGEPETDKVIGIPIALWDRLRDIATRLERVERETFGEVEHGVLVAKLRETCRALAEVEDISLEEAAKRIGTMLTEDVEPYREAGFTLPEPPTDVFGNWLRPGIEVVFAGEDGGLVTGTLKQVDDDGLSVAIALDPELRPTIERHPRNVCVRP